MPKQIEQVIKKDFDNTRGFRTLNVMMKNHPSVRHDWPNQGGEAGWELSLVNEMHQYSVSISEDKVIGPEAATFYNGYRNCNLMDGIRRICKDRKMGEHTQPSVDDKEKKKKSGVTFTCRTE